jgi:hypothetical protein
MTQKIAVKICIRMFFYLIPNVWKEIHLMERHNTWSILIWFEINHH